ncbi:MAG: hypothetical protein JW807_01685 [Spirochaetes bacterium]|nr:hypothetical protein [Spirochaetota bacterium]
MQHSRLFGIVIIATLSVSLSCSDDTGGDNAAALLFLLGSRNYYLGLTPFPFDISSVDKVEYVYDKIRADADMIVHHFDNGIPWDDALADTYPYTAKVMDDWAFRKSHIPAGHRLYVAVTPINSMRDGLAPDWNSTGDNQPLSPPWDGYDFNHNDVKTAYLNYCRRVIAYFSPDYIAVGVEVNLVREKTLRWASYLELHQGVYATLKAENPSLPIFVTLTGIDLVDDYSDSNHAEQMAALADITDYTDYYAISLHPFFAEIPDAILPDDMFDRIFSSGLNTAGKPACITETSFPAEELTMTDYDPDITLAGTEAKQRAYFSLLLREAEKHNLLFVVNFLVRDYDVLWETTLGAPEDILKAWRDTGFYDEDGDPRPALAVWKSRLRLPVK